MKNPFKRHTPPNAAEVPAEPAPVDKTNFVHCDTHGDDQVTVMFSLNNQLIGKYCFQCYNDFLAHNLFNHLWHVIQSVRVTATTMVTFVYVIVVTTTIRSHTQPLSVVMTTQP